MAALADVLRQTSPAMPLDSWIAPQVRAFFEQTYYLRVNRQAELSRLVTDAEFLANPTGHAALFADHGVAHARDVAQQVLHVLDAAHGVLIPTREAARVDFMRGLGVLLAFVHDIGMADGSRFARAMHAEYAVQAALGPEFDPLMALMRQADPGGVRARLAGQPETMLRELLAMAMCHSKSKMPMAVLNDPVKLRQTLIRAAMTDLGVLHQQQRGLVAEPGTAQISQVGATRLRTAYDDFETEGFGWLLASDTPGRALRDDVIDTVRALRCADALRQRGTALKTSGNCEIFVDQSSANAVFALRLGNERLYLLEASDPISAGEANLSSGELDRDGNLRIGFHRGRFRDAETIGFAARSAALVVKDIYADTLGSFVRADDEADAALVGRIGRAEIVLESVDDNPEFVGLVCEALRALDAEAAGRVRIAPSLAAATAAERERYLEGARLDWSEDERRALLARVAQFGHRTDGIDVVDAFRDVRRISLAAGDMLVEAGAPSGFVYIPEANGLSGHPVGGYEAFLVSVWTPVGVTGVVRGATRNATIFALAPMTLIAIPTETYLRHWHRTYDAAAFAALFAGDAAMGT